MSIFKRRINGEPLEFNENSRVHITIWAFFSLIVTIVSCVWGAAWMLSSKVSTHIQETQNTQLQILMTQKSIKDLSDLVMYHHSTDWTLVEQLAFVRDSNSRIFERIGAKDALSDPIEISRQTHIVNRN